MNFIEFLGWLGASLVLLSFSLKTMLPLRITAMVSNVAFFAYGWLMGLTPVCALHGLLFALNAVRVYQIFHFLPTTSCNTHAAESEAEERPAPDAASPGA